MRLLVMVVLHAVAASDHRVAPGRKQDQKAIGVPTYETKLVPFSDHIVTCDQWPHLIQT